VVFDPADGPFALIKRAQRFDDHRGVRGESPPAAGFVALQESIGFIQRIGTGVADLCLRIFGFGGGGVIHPRATRRASQAHQAQGLAARAENRSIRFHTQSLGERFDLIPIIPRGCSFGHSLASSPLSAKSAKMGERRKPSVYRGGQAVRAPQTLVSADCADTQSRMKRGVLLGWMLMLAAVAHGQPVLSEPQLGTNGFQFRLAGEQGEAYVIERSRDLMNWTPVAISTARQATRTVIAPATNFMQVYRAKALTGYGIRAISRINLNGQALESDSFDSSDPLFSTGGRYDSAKRLDGGNVGVYAALTNAGGAVRIRGKLYMGPQGQRRRRLEDSIFREAALIPASLMASFMTTC
jgi:hypothetical protein